MKSSGNQTDVDPEGFELGAEKMQWVDARHLERRANW